MDTLLHNPFTDLALPYFLMLYVAGGIIALVASGVGIWLADDTRDDDLPAEDLSLDPYALAFLRGGAAQVARLAIFDLIERGYLELSAAKRRFGILGAPKMLRRRNTAPDLAALTPIQRAAWNWVSEPRLPSQIAHRHLGLVNMIRPLCQFCTAALNEQLLLETRNRQRTRKAIAWLLLTVLLGVGVYKLIVHVVTGGSESHSLIPPMLAWLACTSIICRPVRLSDRGQRYLDYLSLLWGDWHHASLMAELQTVKLPSTHDALGERLRRMALFGTRSVHSDIEYAD